MEPIPVGLRDEQKGGESAFRCSVTDPADLVVAGFDDDPVADAHRRHVRSDPVDDARHLVAKAHGGAARPGQATHGDVREVAATDAAGNHPDDDIAPSGVGFGDLVDPNVSRPMDSHLQHLEPRSALVGSEQERHGLAHGGVDDLYADAEVVAVVSE